jgi:hypothetical protein
VNILLRFQSGKSVTCSKDACRVTLMTDFMLNPSHVLIADSSKPVCSYDTKTKLMSTLEGFRFSHEQKMQINSYLRR